MSKDLKFIKNSLLVHNISRGFNGGKVFESDNKKKEYLYLMNNKKEKHNIKIVAYCIMNNHVHMIVWGQSKNDISRYMHNINTAYAIKYNRENERMGYVFQGRYNSVPMVSQKQLITCIKYIHMNPVKAKLVKMEDSYVYSSCKWYKKISGIIDYNIIIKIFGSMENCIKLLNSEQIQYIEKGKEKMKEIVKVIAKENGVKVNEIRKNNYLLKEIYMKCEENCIPIYKNELAKQLGINRTTLYRLLKNATF